MKPFQLKQHLQNTHEEQADKSIEYFKLKENGVQRFRLDTAGAFHQTNDSIIETSYTVALRIEETAQHRRNIG